MGRLKTDLFFIPLARRMENETMNAIEFLKNAFCVKGMSPESLTSIPIVANPMDEIRMKIIPRLMFIYFSIPALY